MQLVFNNKYTDYFVQPSAVKLLKLTKQNFTPFIKYRVSEAHIARKTDIIRNLNLGLFQLKLLSDKLIDTSFFSIPNLLTVISTNEFAVEAHLSNINTTLLLPKVVSRRAEELTSSNFATEYTPIEDIKGYILVEGRKIEFGAEKGNTSLYEISSRINNLNIGINAEIIDNQLVLTSTTGNIPNVADLTYGRGRLGLRIVSFTNEEELLNRLFGPIPEGGMINFTTLKEVSSYKIEDITGIKGATVATPLYHIKGNIIINDRVIPVNLGIQDTLETLAQRINSIKDLYAEAKVENNRLIIRSTDFTKPLTVKDETKGGLINGLGLSRTAEAKLADKTSAVSFARYNIDILSIAQRQMNISYSAVEITGNPVANERTPLGLSGYLIINDTRIYLQPQQALKDIQTLINTLVENVNATIIGKKLVLEAKGINSNAFQIEDYSTGGERGGLGIARPSYEVRSQPINVILGIKEANENTFLHGITGELEINSQRIKVGIRGISDTLSRLRDYINQNITGVEATIKDNRLIIKSTTINPVIIKDYTTGGYASQGFGSFSFTTSPSTIVEAQNSVFYRNGKVFSEHTVFVTDATPSVNYNLKSPTPNPVLVQLTNLNNIEMISNLIENFVTKYNEVAEKLQQLIQFNTLTREEGLFFENKSLYSFYERLEEIIREALAKVDIGINLKVTTNGTKIKLLEIDKPKLTQNIHNNLLNVLDLFRNEEYGIATRISEFLTDLYLGNLLPSVDIRDVQRFRGITYYAMGILKRGGNFIENYA